MVGAEYIRSLPRQPADRSIQPLRKYDCGGKAEMEQLSPTAPGMDTISELISGLASRWGHGGRTLQARSRIIVGISVMYVPLQ